MKKRFYLILIAIMLCFNFTACRNIENDENVACEYQIYSEEELKKENGNKIEKTFGSGDNQYDFEATVLVWGTYLKTGKFIEIFPDKEEIGNLLSENATYSIEDHYARYDDPEIQDIGTDESANAETKSNMTEDEINILNEYNKQAKNICKSLEINTTDDNQNLIVAGERTEGEIHLWSVIDDIPIVNDEHVFMTTDMFLTDKGVSAITFAPNFRFKDSNEVGIITIDQLMELLADYFDKGVISKEDYEINQITTIGLTYYADYNTQELIPAWCLMEDFGGTKLIVHCINAGTGELIY